MDTQLEEVLTKQTGILEVLSRNLKPSPWITVLAVSMLVQVCFTLVLIYNAVQVQRLVTVLDIEILNEE